VVRAPGAADEPEESVDVEVLRYQVEDRIDRGLKDLGETDRRRCEPTTMRGKGTDQRSAGLIVIQERVNSGAEDPTAPWDLAAPVLKLEEGFLLHANAAEMYELAHEPGQLGRRARSRRARAPCPARSA